MKKLLSLLIAAILLITMTACDPYSPMMGPVDDPSIPSIDYPTDDTTEDASSDEIEIMSTTIDVLGMTTEECVALLKDTLLENPRVISVKANLEASTITVVHEAMPRVRLLMDVVDADERFTVLHTLAVNGMMCNDCVIAIEDLLTPIDGVINVSIDLRDEVVVVENIGICRTILVNAIESNPKFTVN
jgi:copper chaperone CopZ/predicted small lipoprotein YifL